MKKLVVVLISGLLLLSGCAIIKAETASVTLQKLMEVTVTYSDGSTSRQEYLYESTASWPADGCVFYKNDTEQGREEYEYDKHGNTIRIRQNDGTELTFELSYEDDNLVCKVAFVDGVEDYTETYLYSEQGQVVEQSEYRNGVLQCCTKTEYTETGKRLKECVYDGSGNLLCYRDFAYDKRGFTGTVHEYNAAGVLQGYLVDSYDISGFVIIEEHYNADDILLSTTHWKYIPHKRSVTVFSREF